MRTIVGYAGGEKDNPSYQLIKDHSEAILIEYDPSVVTYEELIEMFWEGHSPTSRPYSRQYMSLVLYGNEEEKEIAQKTKNYREEKLDARIYTEIRELDTFYPAENYHQKYYLQSRSRLHNGILDLYPDFDSFVSSTTAARLNGYVGGYGTKDELERDLSRMDLDTETEQLARENARVK